MSEAAEAFYAEAGRRTYVTPTAFLELLALLAALLAAQRRRQADALQRFATGLAKLEASAGQVAGMQAQLRVRRTATSHSDGPPAFTWLAQEGFGASMRCRRTCSGRHCRVECVSCLINQCMLNLRRCQADMKLESCVIDV